MKIVYRVRQLTYEGLLVKPPTCGPYYNEYSPFYHDFETEAEAVKAIEDCFNGEYKYNFQDLTIIKVYSYSWE